jgi:hypothetical protein
LLSRLAKFEIHTITSCIKKFLRQLKEPIIPLSLWHDFVNAANNPDTTFAETDLYQVHQMFLNEQLSHIALCLH